MSFLKNSAKSDAVSTVPPSTAMILHLRLHFWVGEEDLEMADCKQITMYTKSDSMAVNSDERWLNAWSTAAFEVLKTI